jgi:hypothetical protein
VFASLLALARRAPFAEGPGSRIRVIIPASGILTVLGSRTMFEATSAYYHAQRVADSFRDATGNMVPRGQRYQRAIESYDTEHEQTNKRVAPAAPKSIVIGARAAVAQGKRPVPLWAPDFAVPANRPKRSPQPEIPAAADRTPDAKRPCPQGAAKAQSSLVYVTGRGVASADTPMPAAALGGSGSGSYSSEEWTRAPSAVYVESTTGYAQAPARVRR